LWLATIAVILLVASPYYINAGAKPAIAGEVQQASTCTLKVAAMTCRGCAAAVESAANAVDGVKETAVSYDEGLATVTYDPAKTSPEAIARAIAERSGFNAEVQVPKDK
jgi:copper chaperone